MRIATQDGSCRTSPTFCWWRADVPSQRSRAVNGTATHRPRPHRLGSPWTRNCRPGATREDRAGWGVHELTTRATTTRRRWTTTSCTHLPAVGIGVLSGGRDATCRHQQDGMRPSAETIGSAGETHPELVVRGNATTLVKVLAAAAVLRVEATDAISSGTSKASADPWSGRRRTLPQRRTPCHHDLTTTSEPAEAPRQRNNNANDHPGSDPR